MLCRFCQDFDYDQLKNYSRKSSETGYPHHASLADLAGSARNGCEICALVLAETESRSHIGDNKEYPLSCWFSWDLGDITWNDSCNDYLASFIPCTTADDPLCAIIKGRVRHRDVLSEECLQMAKNWLNSCREGHQKCPQQSDLPLPTRVIDVGSTLSEPRLVSTDHRLGKWVALSHCWGSHQPLKTEIMTLESHCNSLPLSCLPPSFRDAIIITRALGVQYLWIDSLCILQDSKDDWLSESAMMGSIFKNAVVTIAADASPNSSVGIVGSSLLARQSKLHSTRARCHSTTRNLNGFLYLERPAAEHYLTPGPLSQRGWALQEAILSPRILSFTSNLVFWRCVEMQRNELFPDPELSGTGQRRTSSCVASSYLETVNMSPRISRNWRKTFNQDILSYWYGHVVDEYVIRKLTHQSDKFIAIAGIAREVQPYIGGSEYKAGLWMSDIHRGLLWNPSRRKSAEGAIRYNEYISPSWSWASIDFTQSKGEEDVRYIYQDLIGRDINPLAVILEISVSNVNENPFGQVESGSLIIRGECRHVCSCRVPLAFFDDRTCQYEHETPAYDDGDGDGDGDIDFYYDHMYNIRQAYIGGYSVKVKNDLTMFNNFDFHSYEELRMARIGTQDCLINTEENHRQLVYIKIANVSTPNQGQIVAALVLEQLPGEGAIKYTRVGRALMIEDPGGYPIPYGFLTLVEEDIAWPTETVTIV